MRYIHISGASDEMRLACGLLTGHSKKNFKLIPSMVVVPVASCSNLTFDPLHAPGGGLASNSESAVCREDKEEEGEVRISGGYLCQEAAPSSVTDWRTWRRGGQV